MLRTRTSNLDNWIRFSHLLCYVKIRGIFERDHFKILLWNKDSYDVFLKHYEVLVWQKFFLNFLKETNFGHFPYIFNSKSIDNEWIDLYLLYISLGLSNKNSNLDQKKIMYLLFKLSNNISFKNCIKIYKFVLNIQQ